MKEIDEYVESLYKNVRGDHQELNDLKLEMKQHILDKVGELQADGRTREESLTIAFERFGEVRLLDEGLKEAFGPVRPLLISVLAIIHLIIGLLHIGNIGSLLNLGSLGSFFALYPTIFQSVLAISSAIGMWLGKRWGWWLAAFIYTYCILQFFYYLLGIPAYVEQLPPATMNVPAHYWEVVGFIFYLALSIVLWKRGVLTYFKLERTSWLRKMVLLLVVVYLSSLVYDWIFRWLLDLYYPGVLAFG